MANYCSCGRNLAYPAKETEKAIICRCGKRHSKEKLKLKSEKLKQHAVL